MPQFERYIGIDYAGAETPTSSLYDGDETDNPDEGRSSWREFGARWFSCTCSKNSPLRLLPLSIRSVWLALHWTVSLRHPLDETRSSLPPAF
jgi:hypothetical protein